MKVIREDGLVMDFKMLMKSPGCRVHNYWGTTPVGQIDHEWVKLQKSIEQIVQKEVLANRANIVS